MMCVKVDRVLEFFSDQVKEGIHWGDLPLTYQIEAVNILYNDNKRFYDRKAKGSDHYGKCDLLIEHCYKQYEFAESTMIPANKQAEMEAIDK